MFVHGACVKDGAWWWHPAAELLAERGVASEAPFLPSCGETGARGAGLAEDVASVRDVLTAGDEPAVVVAHSYGGIVTAEAAAGVDAVRPPAADLELPARGRAEPLPRSAGEEPAPFLAMDPERGAFTVRGESLAETFLQDCEPEIQREALEKTAWQSLAVLKAPVPVGGVAARALDVSRLRAGPRGTPADRQREFSARRGQRRGSDAGHHPFLSRPAGVRRPDALALGDARDGQHRDEAARALVLARVAQPPGGRAPRSRNSSCAASGERLDVGASAAGAEPVPPRVGARVGAIDVRAGRLMSSKPASLEHRRSSPGRLGHAPAPAADLREQLGRRPWLATRPHSSPSQVPNIIPP